jgi:phosphate-selective porin OprO and OprP
MEAGRRHPRAARATLWVAGAAGLCLAGTAEADESREAQLESRVRELERQLREVHERLGTAPAPQSELEQRVAELEKLTKKDDGGIFGSWSNGFRFDSADRAFSFRVTGRMHVDFGRWSAKSSIREALDDDLPTAAAFRRARMGFTGVFYRDFEYKAEWDFAGGDASFRDVYLAYTTECAGRFRVGHFKEPFGLDELTSSNNITFIERHLGSLTPAFNTGLGWDMGLMDGDLVLQAGVFRDANDYGNDLGNTDHGGWNWTGRVAGRPWVNEEGDQYVHLGVAGSLRDHKNDEVRFRARPENFLSPRFVDTGTFEADGSTLLGLEGGAVFGPFHMQAEWMRADVDAVDMPDPRFDGFAVQAGVFLTGEPRRWRGGAWDSVRVKNKFGREAQDGWGAWELALRYSKLDLDSKDVRGGELDAWTLGLNWYLNNNTRFMLNLVRADTDRPAVGLDGKATAIMARFQVSF